VTANPVDRARRIALTLLSEVAVPARDDLARAARQAEAAIQAVGEEVDMDLLMRLLEADVRVFVEDGSVLEDDDSNHEPWLHARRAEIDWRFWDAYEAWSRRRMPKGVVDRLHMLTDDTLDRLEDPRRDGRWDRRGMVVGQVQSGKTGNYTGLICKAADAGYKFIVVLAGLHNSLRSQTQARLDEGFLGLDSRTSLAFENTNRSIGVGTGGVRHPAAYTLTSSDELGDFGRGVATRVAGRIGSDPVLLVVKKHKSILTNLIAWVTSINGRPGEGGRPVIADFPLLVIDDEADNASVNTKRIEYDRSEDGVLRGQTDPSEINKQIRRLLSSFTRSAFVAYTATPFANIFIDEEEPSAEYGEDLFPRSFILRIPPPTNYVGPAEVFGVPRGAVGDGAERPGLPVVRRVMDEEAWLRTGHKKDAAPGRPPASLRSAVRSFVLVCAARAARGQIDVHNSMLVHVTRFVDVQGQVRDQIQSLVDGMRDGVAGGDGQLVGELRDLWDTDFAPTTLAVPPALRGTPLFWEEVAAQLRSAVERIRPVLAINGSARDALTYADHPRGVSVIAVGGDKLSRGLTLEGLSVSYYLRASKMYDTLMQMGRWFGYRDGYTDLIRLYTTPELVGWYRDITVANEELSERFDEMARVGSNPRDFSLYVRKSPAGLLVTAQAKMRSGRDMELTFSGDVIETIGFRHDVDSQRRNLAIFEDLLVTQTAAGRGDETLRRRPAWRGVPGGEVAGMLERFETYDGAHKARGGLLARYIRDRVAHGELIRWTIVAISNTQTTRTISVAGETIGLTERGEHQLQSAGEAPSEDGGTYRIRRLGDPTHEQIDLDDSELERAEAMRDHDQRALRDEARRRGAPEPRPLAIGRFVRRVRPTSRGLIVLYWLDPDRARLPGVDAIPGFLISFPDSPDAPTISYRVPGRYWETIAS
jgi:hypothetical protein